MSDPLLWIDDENAERSRLGLSRRLTTLDASSPGHVLRDGRSLINFASNDYLGLAADPRVVAAAAEAGERYGFGAGASALVSGWMTPHEALAESLAEFEKVEAVALFPSGFAANLGTISALVGPGDAVYLDRLNHACLIDGVRLSGASLRVYPHLDVDRLRTRMERDQGRYRRSLVATDGVFSMDGDVAPLAEIASLCDRFGTMLLVDEAHGTGVFGPDGRGAASECGIADRVHAKVGTLSKALGSIGGFVGGSRRLIDHLLSRARSLIYSTALPPPAVAAASEALRIVQKEPWRRIKARHRGDAFRSEMRAAGLEIPPSSGPIIPVILGDPTRAMVVAERLRSEGFFVSAIRPPTVPENTARLRISLSAIHSEAEIEALGVALRAAVG